MPDQQLARDSATLIATRCPELAQEAAMVLRSSAPTARIPRLVTAALGHDVWSEEERRLLLAAMQDAQGAARAVMEIQMPVLVTAEQLARYTAAARADGLSRAAWVRRVLDRECGEH